ncbi:MAG: hypothetical protein U0984_05105 [Prosthecobacter sp.]|nr:hypothetical protein [Prosthecobacter sp.]
MKTQNSIEVLVGNVLSHVCFVMDYLQLGFDGRILNCYSAPYAHTAAGTVTYPDPGSRDALCSFIGRELTAIEVIDEVKLVLFFTNETIVIPLDMASRKFGDAAEYIGEASESMIYF